MDNELTQEQAAEVIIHLAFYTGWPHAMSALPVAKEVFAKRSGRRSEVMRRVRRAAGASPEDRIRCG
jgi:Carboxymuconolactone decarboxylase family